MCVSDPVVVKYLGKTVDICLPVILFHSIDFHV